MNKFIDGYHCPCCGCSLSGNFDVNHVQYNKNFGNDVVYNIYRLNCPRKNRPITMLESSLTNSKIFWITEDERALDKYIKMEKIKSKTIKNAIIYLYFPIYKETELIVDRLREKMKPYTDEGYKLSLAVPDFLDKYTKCLDNNLFKKWVLDSRFYSMCFGTKYPSVLAEINLLNEKHKWKDCVLVSTYPTIANGFDYIGDELDWEQIEHGCLLNCE